MPAGRMSKRGRFLVCISPVVGGLPGDGVVGHHREWLVCRVARLCRRHLAAPAGRHLPGAPPGFNPPQGGLRARAGVAAPRESGCPHRYRISCFLGAILVYGLFIYQGPIQRVITLLIGAAIVVVTFEMLRRGTLKKRAVVELRADYSPGGQHQFNVTAGGKPAVTPVRLEYTDCVEQVTSASGVAPCSVFALLGGV